MAKRPETGDGRDMLRLAIESSFPFRRRRLIMIKDRTIRTSAAMLPTTGAAIQALDEPLSLLFSVLALLGLLPREELGVELAPATELLSDGLTPRVEDMEDGIRVSESGGWPPAAGVVAAGVAAVLATSDIGMGTATLPPGGVKKTAPPAPTPVDCWGTGIVVTPGATVVAASAEEATAATFPITAV